MNEFKTIDLATLDNVTGGAGAGQAIKKAAGWTWRNVIGPAGGAAAVDWAANKWSGGGGQQPSQQPTTPAQ